MPSPRTHAASPPSTLGVIRLAWAAALLAAPAAVISTLGGPVDSTSMAVARILGARHITQGLIEVAGWPKWRRAGAVIDATHSLTAAAVGVSSARWRRVSLADSAVAGVFAYAGWP